MSPSEKRAASIYLSQIGRKGDDFFTLMFKALERQEVYDEEGLKRTLKMDSPELSSRFAVRKNRLFNHLLESLRKFNSMKSINMTLRKKLDFIELLVARGLYREAEVKIKEANLLAQENEKFFVLAECSYWQRKIAKETEDQLLAEVVGEINRDERIYLSHLIEESELRSLHDESYVSLKQKKKWDNDFREKVAAIAGAVPSSEEIQLRTFESKLAYYSVHLNLHLMDGNIEKIYEDFSRIIETWDAYPQKAKEFPERYAKSSAFYLYYRTQICESSEDISERMVSIRNTAGLSAFERGRILNLTYNLEFVWYLNTGRFQKAAEIIPQLEKDLESNMVSIDPANKVIHYYNICVVLFLQQEWKKALQRIRKIIDWNKTAAKPHIRNFARLLDLAIHFELGNESFIYYSYLRSAIRQLTKEKDLSRFEQVFTQYIRQLCDEKLKASGFAGHTAAELRRIFSDFYAELSEIQKNETPLAQGAEIILSWVKSRANDRPMVEILLED